MPKVASDYASLFVTMLNAKLGNDKDSYEIDALTKYDRIVRVSYGSRSAYAFVEKSTGHVFKSAGWAAPAKGVRYSNVFAAAEKADPYGSFLYK